MKFAAIFLTAALIARNNLYFNGPFEIMRGLALVMVAVFGSFGLFQPRVLLVLPRYWPQIGYIIAMVLSLLVTDYPAYVGFQTLSVTAVIAFSIACAESANADRIQNGIMTTVFWGYGLLMILSLALYIIKPPLAYETLYGGEIRFRGIFPKSGVTGASAGVLAGVCLFVRNRKLWLRAGVLIIALACLLLTQSRTFWVAAFIAGLATYRLYFRHSGKIILLTTILLGFVIATAYVAEVKIIGKGFERFARVGSITNLTGRTQLWQEALEKFKDQPYLGRGLTAGSSAFINPNDIRGFNNNPDDLSSNRQIGMSTMHSGYIQSLLDLGLFGTVFYVSLILLAIWRIFKMDDNRQYPVIFYLLVFIAIANISENVIYAATVYNSVLFFMTSAFAISLKPRSKPKPGATTEPRTPFWQSPERRQAIWAPADPGTIIRPTLPHGMEDNIIR